VSYITGNEKGEFLIEDDGTVWNVRKTVKYDPKTFLPAGTTIMELCSKPKKRARPKKFVCQICGYRLKSAHGMKKHLFAVHEDHKAAVTLHKNHAPEAVTQ
jgi:hypothetical protein